MTEGISNGNKNSEGKKNFDAKKLDGWTAESYWRISNGGAMIDSP